MARPARGKEVLSNAREAVAFLAPFLDKAAQGGCWLLEKSSGRLMPTWVEKFRYPLSIICCIATTGGSLRLTRGAGRLMSGRRRNGKKIPELLCLIDNQWTGKGRLRVMFQEEARFGRIS